MKCVAQNSIRKKSLLTMRNIPHTEDRDVAGNSNINKNGEIDMSFI
ncbi:MAG: hypothetical protein WBL68_01490 [Nitrososphaeraceae archaeon]